MATTLVVSLAADAGAATPARAAATPTGALYAFGSNGSDQLGTAINKGTPRPNSTPMLVTLPGSNGAVTQTAAGGNFSLAVSAAGRLYAFGDNHFGELGFATNSGTTQPIPTPTLVGLPGQSGAVTQVAAGGAFSLVLTATGQLYGFGNNDSGELGSTTNNAASNGVLKPNPKPARISLPGQDGVVTQIAAGFDHSLVATSSGQLYAFGYNGGGGLGNATNDGADVANPVPTLVNLPGRIGGVTRIAAGGFHSLAVTSSGQLYAFGENNFGQLGIATSYATLNATPTPTLVTLPGRVGGVTQIAAGYDHSLVVTGGDQLYTFGDNNFGQLGVPAIASTPTPTRVGLPGQVGAITHVAAGYYHSLVVTAGGQLYAFGENNFGQLGAANNSGTGKAVSTPTAVRLPQGTKVDTVSEGPAAFHTLAIVSGPPTLSPVGQSHSQWREGSRLARISRQVKPPVGTTFSFTLSQVATVSLSFTQRLSGRRISGRCVALTAGNRKRQKCVRTVTRGTLTFSGHSGQDNVSFQGRVSPGHRLAPGHYTLMVIATNAAGQRSKLRSVSFTIVP